MPTAPDAIVPGGLPTAPAAPVNAAGSGSVAAPTAPVNAAGSGAVAVPAVPVDTVGSGSVAGGDDTITVTGELYDGSLNPVTFPVLLRAGDKDGHPYYSDNGLQAGTTHRLGWVPAANRWFLTQSSPSASWRSNPEGDLATPQLITSMIPAIMEGGSPVLVFPTAISPPDVIQPGGPPTAPAAPGSPQPGVIPSAPTAPANAAGSGTVSAPTVPTPVQP